jgi:uncharacterized protein YhdP
MFSASVQRRIMKGVHAVGPGPCAWDQDKDIACPDTAGPDQPLRVKIMSARLDGDEWMSVWDESKDTMRIAGLDRRVDIRPQELATLPRCERT